MKATGVRPGVEITGDGITHAGAGFEPFMTHGGAFIKSQLGVDLGFALSLEPHL